MIEPKNITIAEFDAWVQTADEAFTYELHDGIVYAFATGTQNHGELCSAGEDRAADGSFTLPHFSRIDFGSAEAGSSVVGRS